MLVPGTTVACAAIASNSIRIRLNAANGKSTIPSVARAIVRDSDPTPPSKIRLASSLTNYGGPLLRPSKVQEVCQRQGFQSIVAWTRKAVKPIRDSRCNFPALLRDSRGDDPQASCRPILLEKDDELVAQQKYPPAATIDRSAP